MAQRRRGIAQGFDVRITPGWFAAPLAEDQILLRVSKNMIFIDL